MNRLKARILRFLPEEKKFLNQIYSKFIDDHANLWKEAENLDLARLRYILFIIIKLFYEEHKHIDNINQIDQQEFQRKVRELIANPDALLQKTQKAQIKAIDRLGVERWFNAFKKDIEKINEIIERYERDGESKSHSSPNRPNMTLITMRKFTLNQGDLYMSNDRLRDFSIRTESDAQEFFDDTLEKVFGSSPKYKEFIDLYGRLNQLQRYALLAAHGSAKGNWVYYNEKRELNVQNWINLFDGKYSGLLIHVCNPGSYTPQTKKSVLIIPDANVDFTGGDARSAIFTLLVPKLGEIDSYTVDYEIDRLKTKLGKKNSPKP